MEEAELCFPQLLNASCKRPTQHQAESVFISVLLSCISLLTAALNLLVIVSISHFRQLHTPTNLLLLSLAVSDFLVGFLLMPFGIFLIGSCWFLGKFMCGFFQYTSFTITSSSVGNMVLISVDRYVAIHDPLTYTTMVTQRRVRVCVYLCWACSVSYNGVVLNTFLKNPDAYNSCYGECVAVINYVTGAVDVVLTFIGPITVIIVLYMRVFVVAVSQARAMRSQIMSLQGSICVVAQKSERKAAKTLGVVVVVFLICFCPYYYPSLVGEDTSPSTTAAFSIFGVWLLYCNSCMNPVIYAYFYPWFRKSIRLIVTLQILKPGSCDANMLQ